MSAAFALLGHPVSHSLSPGMFNTVFAREGIDAHYSAIDVPPGVPLNLRDLFTDHGLSGANLTIPHKTAVLNQLDHMSDEAARAGAVNVVIRQGDSLIGYNTDGRGFLDGLDEKPGHAVMLLGAGGAARAIASAVMSEGVRELVVLNRSSERAEAMLRVLRTSSSAATMKRAPLTMEAFAEAAARVTLVVNCTSGGARPVIDTFLPSALAPGACWVDINYWDPNPPAQAACRAANVRFQTGHSMLAHQAAHGFFLFTGRRCDGDDFLSLIT